MNGTKGSLMYQKFVGISAETAALIESHRNNPQETEDEIIRRGLSSKIEVEQASSRLGCDLGNGAVLEDGEKVYLFRYKASREQGKPEAVAEAKGQALYLYGRRVKKSKGSFVQPALRMYQEKVDDRNPKGAYISLDAWEYWYVRRDNKFIRVGDLRNQDMITRRGTMNGEISISPEELGF
jgi:hypothetical protein